VAIRNPRLGASVTTAIVDGGFDPVPLAAAAGDTLTLSVQTSSAGSVSYMRAVPPNRAPIVVRTSPPNHRRDVPLNALIEVVFSEPMDSVSLSTAVRLSAGGSSITGSVIIPPNSGAILRATFVPSGQLTPLTKYELDVDVTARDQQRNPLAVPVSADFTTSSRGADTLAPFVSVLTPTPGDTLPLKYESFEVRIRAEQSVAELLVLLTDQESGEQHYVDIHSYETFGAPLFHINGIYSPNPDLTPGTYTVRVSATDLAGNTGSTVPFSVTLAAPDTSPRIVVQSFSVVESEKTPHSGYWIYAPQLSVADAPGQAGLEIIGFEMTSIPGVQIPWPRVWARSLAVPPDQSTALFHEIYGDFEVAFEDGHGTRSSGGQAIARLTYRDGSGHNYSTTLQGPIVPGPLLNPPTASCGHWEPMGMEASSGCLAALRQVAP